MATRSTTVAAIAAVAGGQTIYTSPANLTTIIKSIFVANYGAVDDIISMQVQRAFHVSAYIFFNTALPATSKLEWNGWIVLEPGDIWTMHVNTATVSVWGNGALLPGIA